MTTDLHTLPLVTANDEPPAELAIHREAMREAFMHSGLRRYSISFAHALDTPPIAICLRIAAEIRIRKQQEQRA